MVLKRPCHNQNKNTCKELSQNGACNLDIGTQYWTDLHGIALKNNELNVVMVGIRHWGLVLICILYKAWQRGFSADIFAPVHDNNMSTQFLCARSCTANIFMYTKVCALAKCNLFQPAAFQFYCQKSLCFSTCSRASWPTTFIYNTVQIFTTFSFNFPWLNQGLPSNS